MTRSVARAISRAGNIHLLKRGQAGGMALPLYGSCLPCAVSLSASSIYRLEIRYISVSRVENIFPSIFSYHVQ